MCVWFALMFLFVYSVFCVVTSRMLGIDHKDWKLKLPQKTYNLTSEICIVLILYQKLLYISLSHFIQLCTFLMSAVAVGSSVHMLFMCCFQKICIEQLKALVSLKCWDAVIRYVVMAWKYVHQLPNWDDPAHNKTKLSCFRCLAAQCLTAITSAPFTSSELTGIRQK